MKLQTLLLVIVAVIGLGVVVFSAIAPVEPVTKSDRTSRASGTKPADGSDRPLVVDETSTAPPGMVWVRGGAFTMGNEAGMNDEKPEHPVEVDGFWMDETEVTNAQFKAFAEATGYKTVAERKPKREDFIDQVPDISAIPEENLVAGSICFNPKFDRANLRKVGPNWPYQVWMYQKDANWRHPEGPESSIDDRLDHPVVHMAWHDAVKYCEWAGKRLPTEAEWEYASRAGRKGETYPWGNERNPGGKWLNNIWQGEFPEENRNEDGFLTTAPVKHFPANGYGLYEMSGNVWEWCSDYYRPEYYLDSPRRNPTGPDDSHDPNEPGIVKRVQRGGSFMCSDNYCIAYRNAARMKGEPSSGTFHCGFRCVVAADMQETYKHAPARKTAKSAGG